jgi:hypothetical protein
MSADKSRRPGEEPKDEARRAGAGVERRLRTGRGAARIPRRIALAALAVSVVGAGSALAFQPLPPGAQVNDDLAAGINKNISVSGEDPTNTDVVGGSLVAGNPAVPWAVFRQRETNGSAPPHDQVFSRSFAAGAWTTRGSGTVGGRSSASPQFPGSLNFDQGEDAEVPEIDFAGAGRTVPWATWYEDTPGPGFGENNVFASRFDVTQNKWIFAGQNRGTGGGSVMVPSLNIHTDQDAENSSVAGGSAVDPTKPGPWVTWQETTTQPANGSDQIFVERPIGPGAANCDGVQPAGVAVAGHVPAIGGFCWQQTGIPRVGPGRADPSLNVDPTRNGVEPDIAFTGANDSVPWVVWYEKDSTSISGLQNNEMVFAAKGIPDGVAANGGFHWVAVGNQLSGTLDTSGTHGFGACAESATTEQQCALNDDPTADAEDPRVAAGTMTAGTPTVPWVVWDESVSGVDRIFVSRLVGTGTGAHFEIANNGAPLARFTHGDTRPDITFAANTPYVTWRADFLGRTRGFVGHFVNPSNPIFVFDEFNVPLTPTSVADVREPISSNCTANPFNADGTACQGAPVATPFFLFTQGTNTLRLFAGAITTGAFDPTAKLLAHGRKVGASGPGVVCKPGERVLLTVRIKQGRSTAVGVWRKHGCNNNPPQWHVVLTVTGGKRLHLGRATGQGSARITRHGNVVRVVRWTRAVALIR